MGTGIHSSLYYSDHHFSIIMYLMENGTSPASDAPAIANFALLMAKGSALKYVDILNDLYTENGLHVPDFSKYLPQSEQEQTDITCFEENGSFMAELDECQSTGLLATAFTKTYCEIYPQEARDFKDWFDINKGYGSSAYNSRCEESSTPISSCRKSLPKDRKSKLLDRNSNLLFDFTVESIPEQVLDKAINQAEDLNETTGFPKLDFSSSDSDDDEGYGSSAYNSRCEESSTPISSCGHSLTKDLKSKRLDRNSNLLFDLTVETIPDQVLDNAINQAEVLNETIGFPKLDFSSSYSDGDESYGSSAYNSRCKESSTPISSCRKSLPKDLISKLLDCNSNLLFDLTVESIPDLVLDSAIRQAEVLNEATDFLNWISVHQIAGVTKAMAPRLIT